MSDIVHLLPDSVANQIAAGEVIQRPASVLKELVENSIDAGAGSIQIVIKDAGRTLIQVIDNGKGMSETDARMAFERHATSKISDAADLFSLRTLGFRGEALASIAAVAQVELRTRREEDELGCLIEIAGSRVFKQEAVQCSQGSVFSVKNLFFNVPARRRFLKSDTVEKNHLLNEFYRIALVYPQIEFAFFDDKDEIFQLPPSNIKLRIENLFGKSNRKKWEQQLLAIEVPSTLVNIYGYIGRPEFAQRSANQYFFVNGRYMRHPYFNKAVMSAYERLIQPGENPNYFIYLEVDPQTIDVNIHPTKTEIKFENEPAIWSIIQATVKETLGKFNVSPSIDFDREGMLDIPVPGQVAPEHIRPPQPVFNPSYNPFTPASYKRENLDWEELYAGFEKKARANSAAVTELQNENLSLDYSSSLDTTSLQTGMDLEDVKAHNFQFKNRYVLTPVKSGLLVVDQHRAHVRVLYELFLLQMGGKETASQHLLFPEEISLSAGDALVFAQILPDLKRVGFSLDGVGDSTYLLKGIPPMLVEAGAAVELLMALLDKAKLLENSAANELHESFALSLAEASALKIGQRLTEEEMTDLIDRLFACQNHNYTPDGKKILTILTSDELEAKFR